MSRAKKKETLHTTRRVDTLRQASVPAPVNATDRMAIIAEAAYFLAEKRQFTPGCELDDWLAAEQQIQADLRCTSTPRSSG